MEDFNQLTVVLSDALKSVANDFSSGWLLIQIALIFIAGLIGTICAAVLRRKIDLTSQTMGWPPLLRLMARLLLANIGTVIFVLIVTVERKVMLSMTWPSRSYPIFWASPPVSPPHGWRSR